jgi:flagellar hook-associated protein 1 FlgK
MSDLFRMLTSTAHTLEAQRYALDVTGQNIANVNTPGYVRRSVQFAEIPPRDAWSAGGGVDIAAVQAARAPLLESRLRHEQTEGAREAVVAEQLEALLSGFGLPGASLDGALTRFYTTYGELAVNPTSASARQQIVVEAQALGSAFKNLSTQVQNARAATDRDVRNAVQEINALAEELAQVNKAVAGAAAGTLEPLRDRQAVVLSGLTALTDVSVIARDDGLVDVAIGNGRALVVGSRSYELTVSSTPPLGFAAILTDGADVTTDITAEIAGGRVGGLLQTRDGMTPAYLQQLDQLAHGVVADVNALTSGGFDLDGNPGQPLFNPIAAIAGAAGVVTVNSAVAANLRLVVASGLPAAGNNDVARAIAALQDAAVSGGSARPVDAWGDLVYRVAADARSARQVADGHDDVVQQLRALRDQVSGVSIDEEAAMLMRFQRSYEANARFFQVADRALELLMSLAGR